MIKVFVVVTGLALAQLNESGEVVTIDFPLTKDFLVLGDPDMQQDEITWAEEHKFSAQIASSNPPTFTNLTISLPSTDPTIDFESADYFADFTLLYGNTIGGSRTECLSTESLATCRALSKPDQYGERHRQPLLAGRAQIAGTWKLTAKYYDDKKKEYKEDKDTWPIVRFRTPALNPSNSLVHPFAGRLANTMVFEGELDGADEVTVTNGTVTVNLGQGDEAPSNKCDEYELGATCIIILLTNHRHPPCPSQGCILPPWAMDGADTHFLQLYRLLDKYNAKSDQLNLRPFMPYPELMPHPDSTSEANPGTGASSPRCYPAVKS